MMGLIAKVQIIMIWIFFIDMARDTSQGFVFNGTSMANAQWVCYKACENGIFLCYDISAHVFNWFKLNYIPTYLSIFSSLVASG